MIDNKKHFSKREVLLLYNESARKASFVRNQHGYVLIIRAHQPKPSPAEKGKAFCMFAQTRRGALRAPVRATLRPPKTSRLRAKDYPSEAPSGEGVPLLKVKVTLPLKQSLRLAGSPPPLTRTPKTRLRSFRGTPYTREARVVCDTSTPRRMLAFVEPARHPRGSNATEGSCAVDKLVGAPRRA